MNIKLNQNTENNNYKSCALFFSEFSYLIIGILIFLIGSIIPLRHETTEYNSFEGPPWNSSSDPLIFTHISDLHTTSFNNIDKYRALFQTAKKLRANFHLLTGDIADDYKNYLEKRQYKYDENSFDEFMTDTFDNEFSMLHDYDFEDSNSEELYKEIKKYM